MHESDCFAVLLVNARHFDYTDGQAFITTMQSRPDFGHAWIYLKRGGQIIEGGHSGELGFVKPRYFDGIMNNIQYGRPNPTPAEKRMPVYEPNPVKYLWEGLGDGYYQKGSGGHKPTYAIKVDLSEQQWNDIIAFFDAYDFVDYSLTSNQCCSFVRQIAALAGLELEDRIRLPLNKEITVFGDKVRLWSDPEWSEVAFSSPDKLEQSMIEATRSGKAEYALEWYRTSTLSQGGSSGLGRRSAHHAL